MLFDLLNTYAPLITAIGTLLMFIVTLGYVFFTGRQVEASQKALEQATEQTKLVSKQIEVSTQQIKLDKQPLAIPSIISGRLSIFSPKKELFSGQLEIRCKCVNKGIDPAISAFLIGYIIIPKTEKENAKIIVPNTICEPNVCLLKDESYHKTLMFFEHRLKYLYERLNIERDEDGDLKQTTNSRILSEPKLVITIYYKNLVGQWYKSSIQENISGFNKLNDTSYFDEDYSQIDPSKPPLAIYSINLIHPFNSSYFIIEPVTETDVKNDFKKYGHDFSYSQLENKNASEDGEIQYDNMGW